MVSAATASFVSEPDQPAVCQNGTCEGAPSIQCHRTSGIFRAHTDAERVGRPVEQGLKARHRGRKGGQSGGGERVSDDVI